MSFFEYKVSEELFFKIMAHGSNLSQLITKHAKTLNSIKMMGQHLIALTRTDRKINAK